MKKIFYVILLISFSGFAQENSKSLQYVKTITTEGLKDKLSIIASDALEGRMTGTRGQKMAAAFIAYHFQQLGLKGPVNGNYLQQFPLYEASRKQNNLYIDNKKLEDTDSYFYMGNKGTNGMISAPLVFAGKGSSEEIGQIDVKEKAVLVMLDNMKRETFQTVRTILKELKEKGAVTVLFAPQTTAEEFKEMRGMITGTSLRLEKESKEWFEIFFVMPQLTEKLMGTSTKKLNEAIEKKELKKIKSSRISWLNEFEIREVMTENVLGYLEGTDKKDELVIVTAHFDHIGKQEDGSDGVNNGADDDGSGTVSVMQIAEAFAQAKREGNGPRRSMLFMTVTGEEEGLFGSEYYVTHPVFPLTSTVVDLNIDMIGRTDPGHSQDKNYVYVIGSDKLSSKLHELSENTNNTYSKLALDYTYNDQNHPEMLYYRSDHWNFAKNNVPIIFYFDGIHEDYHKPSDEVGKIEFDILAKRAQLIFHTAWEIANREERIVPDAPKK